jgi:hypothetical protein
MKKILIALIIFGAGYTVAKADDPVEPVTINDIKTTVVEQGYKLKDFVVDEIQATKDYQTEQWAIVKAQWTKLITKFSSE